MLAGCKKKEGDYSGKRKWREVEQNDQQKGTLFFFPPTLPPW
jgi:hypothetical protein